ncbi:hypothetical protein AB1I98_25370 [Enterococcus avium]
MTQEKLREIYKERLKREKQTYISEQLKVDACVLSHFKAGKIELYLNLAKRLEDYLTASQK